MPSIKEQIEEAMNSSITESSKNQLISERHTQLVAQASRMNSSPLHHSLVRVPRPSKRAPVPVTQGKARGHSSQEVSTQVPSTEANSVLTEEDLEIFNPLAAREKFTSQLLDRLDREFNESADPEGLPSNLGSSMPANYIIAAPETEQWDVVDKYEEREFAKGEKETHAEAGPATARKASG